MAHPAQAHVRLAVAATALTDPARHVAALTPPAEPAPCVRRVYGGYAEVEDGCRQRSPPTAWVPGLPFEQPEAKICNGRAEKEKRRGRASLRHTSLQMHAMYGSRTLDSCR